MANLINDHLFETRNQLIKEIALVKDEPFNVRPDTKTWSIAQVCHHLFLVEQATIKVIAWELKGNDRSKKERKKVHLMLDRTKKIQAPAIVEPALEPFKVQQIVDMLSDSRKKLMDLLSTIEDQSILMEKSVNHPALGELPLDQWIEMIYLHEQRHIEQIKEIKLFIG
jgi:DinB superfamily